MVLLGSSSTPIAPPHAKLGAAIVAFVSIAVVAPHVFPLTSLSTLSYDWLDADLFLWNFWWTKHALAASELPYWTGLLMYPSGASLAFHSYPMPYSLLTLAIQAAVADVRGLVASFNVIVMVSSAACGLGAYFLALRVTKSVPAAIIAGLVFVCAPYRALNISRLHVVATEVLAWYVWAWVGFTETPTRPRAVLLGLCLALAMYTAPDYALHAAGFSALWLAWASSPNLLQLNSVFWRRLALATVVCVGVASPLVAVQVRSIVQGLVSPTRALEEVTSWSPAVASLVTPSRKHPLYGGLLSAAGDYGTPGVLGMRSETCVALTIWALSIAAVRRIRRDCSQFWFIAAGVFLILTLGPYMRLTGTVTTSVPLPYAALYWLVPPLRFSRDPTRFFAIAILMLSVVSAFGARALLEQLRSWRASILATAAIGALVIFEGLTAWPGKVSANELISPGYDVVAAAPGDFVVLDLSPDQSALLAQTRHGRPITAGRVSIPRSAAASTMLDIERDFLDAAHTLALDPETLAARLVADREELDRLRMRFVVFPTGDAARVELAQRLGLRIVTLGDRVVCERF